MIALLSPRRWALLAAGSIVVALTACSAGDPGGSSGAGSTRVVDSAYGRTEVPAEPTKVVALGLTDVDHVLAAGLTPVIATNWFGGDLPSWTTEALDGEDVAPSQKEVSGDLVFDYDAILQAEPDLILSASTALTEDQQERLSDIAPTVSAIGEGDDELGWQEVTRGGGGVLNRADEADAAIARTEAAINKTRDGHPEWADLRVGLGFPPGPQNEASLATVKDPRMQALTVFGFQPSAGVTQVGEDAQDDFPFVSEENLGLLEADVLFQYMYAEEQRTDALANPLYARLDVVRDDRVVWMSEDFGNALSFGSALSLRRVAELLPEVMQDRTS